MLRVNGFYGHVMRNNFGSLWIFLGFAIAFQILGGVIISLVLLFKDPTKMIFVNPLGYIAEYGIWVGIFSAVFFIGNLFLYKKNVQRDMNFQLIGSMANQRLHKIVQDLSITAGIEQPEIALIHNEARNAFVCGLNESSSTLVVTEGLLKALDDEELAAVIAHEITHIKNGDVRLMAFANTAMTSLLFLEKLNFLKIRGTKTGIIAVLFPPFLILFLSAAFVSGLAMTLGRVSRLMIASSREFIADAEAVRLTHNPAALISALRKIEGMSEIDGIDPVADAMMIDGATIGEFATHPTIVERVSVLIKHSGGMAYDSRPRKDTRFGNLSNHGAGANAGQPIFGLRSKQQTAAEDVSISRASMSVLDRVNVGVEKNAYGLPPKAKIFAYAFMGIILLNILMFSYASTILGGKRDQALRESSKARIEQNIAKAENSKPNLNNSDGLLGLPEYRVGSFDLVSVAIIAIVFLAYVILVKSFERRREREAEKYKLGNF